MWTTHRFLFGKEIFIKFYSRPARKGVTYGMTNRCIDGKYVLFLDFDGHQYDHVLEEMKLFQKKHDLSDLFVFESSPNNYHVVGIDKMTLTRYRKIMGETSSDLAYRDVPFWFGKKAWILRLGYKNGYLPKLVTILKGKRNGVEKSNAHILLLEKIYKIPKKRYGRRDQFTTVHGATYPV
jgi:hypothetical protein